MPIKKDVGKHKRVASKKLRIDIRVTAEEKKQVAELAEMLGMSCSDAILYSVDKQYKKCKKIG